MRTWSGLLLMGLMASQAAGQGAAPASPKGFPPQFLAVQKFDPKSGTVALEYTEFVPVTEQVIVKVTKIKVIDGKNVPFTVDEAVTVRKMVPVTKVVEGKYTIYDSTGAKLTNAEAGKRLSKGTVVVVSGDGALPDAAYRKILNDDAVILVGMQPAIPAVPAPVAPMVLPRKID